MPLYILGINAYHGDAAAAIICDGKLVAAVEEERLNRIKHCAGFPSKAIQFCLKAAGIGIEEVQHIGISRDPSAHLHKKLFFTAIRAARQLATIGGKAAVIPPNQTIGGLSVTENGNARSNGNGHHRVFQQLKDRLDNAGKVRNLRDQLATLFCIPKGQISSQFHHIEHHQSHLASAFYVSPFERAALLSLDGFGDFVSTMWGSGEETVIKVLGKVEYPHSIGILYTATTQFLGFTNYGDEGKVMGLAPYGSPRFIEEFRDIVRLEDYGRFSLNLDYFRHHTDGVEMSWDKGSPVIGPIYSSEFEQTFGARRFPGSPLTDRDRDIAASLQLRLEEVAFHILNNLHRQTGLTDLGLAGGVAYNSVLNGKILKNTPFKRIFVQPAAGDSGTALGVCFQIYNGLLGRPREEVMLGPYTGPKFTNEEIESELKSAGLQYANFTDDELTQHAANDIATGLVVGWFQGQMEFGPRALGNRSIVVDPRRPDMKDILNQRIKRRESFRPFAPSILEERTADYFEQTHPAPTMLMVYQIKPARRNEIPAVAHVDGSGRLQTVSQELNPLYYQLISAFEKLTGVPILLNTSFNENEPIVCTPRDAIECFLKTKMDVLYLGNQCIRKEQLTR